MLQVALEESSGMSRRTIPPEIVRQPEFLRRMKQELDAIEHLTGEIGGYEWKR